MGIRKEEIRRRTRTEIRLCVQEGGDPTQDSDGDLTSLFASSVAHLVAHLFISIMCRTSDLLISLLSYHLSHIQSHIFLSRICRTSLSHIGLSHLCLASFSLLCAGALRSLRSGVWLSDSLSHSRGRRGVSFAASHHPMAQPKARLIREGAGAGTKFDVRNSMFDRCSMMNDCSMMTMMTTVR